MPEKISIWYIQFFWDVAVIPLSFRKTYIPWIMQSDDRGGLQRVLGRFEQARPDSVMPLPVADSGIIRDMDTEEDYREVCQRFAARSLPTMEECQALLDLAATPERVRRHGRAVARVAVAMGLAVNQSRAHDDILDLERIERTALLHDLVKGLPRHAQKSIGERRQRAHNVAARVEAAMGRTLADVTAKLSALALIHLK